MKFTNKEIEYAIEMKELGLDWSPKNGDWCIDPYTDKKLLNPTIFYNQYENDYNPAYLSNRIIEHPDRFIWLPLWHQCREIAEQYGYEIRLFDNSPRDGLVQVSLKNKEKKEAIVYYGETDLSAFYQCIIQILEKEKK